MEKELSDCPICGKNDLLINEIPSRDGTVTFYKIHHVAEIDCGIGLTDTNKERLIQLWNNTELTALRTELERLRGANKKQLIDLVDYVFTNPNEFYKDVIHENADYTPEDIVHFFLEDSNIPPAQTEVSSSINDIKTEDVWTACSRIKADKGYLLNKSAEFNNAYQIGFEDCFEWLKKSTPPAQTDGDCEHDEESPVEAWECDKCGTLRKITHTDK